ncbi:MAG: hypothetical protein R3D71_04530 [Rickettsiales bacterium]
MNEETKNNLVEQRTNSLQQAMDDYERLTGKNSERNIVPYASPEKAVESIKEAFARNGIGEVSDAAKRHMQNAVDDINRVGYENEGNLNTSLPNINAGKANKR